MDDPDVISFLLQTEIIPLCLRIMNTGSELLRTVATFIVQKILLDENGLSYICATPDRFYAVSDVLRCALLIFSWLRPNRFSPCCLVLWSTVSPNSPRCV
jgi:hypothetical protein